MERLVFTANQIAGLGNLTIKDILAYEMKVLTELEFSMHFVPPIDFMDRYIRILGMDVSSEHTSQIKSFARHMCLFTQCDDQFLNFKPS